MKKEAATKPKAALVSKFTLIIGISVFITVLFISAYNFYGTMPIIKQSKDYEANKFVNISNVLYNSAISEVGLEKNLTNTQKLANEFVNQNLLLFAGLVNGKTHKYTWSTDYKATGTLADTENIWKNKALAEKFSTLNPDNIIQNIFQVGDNLLVLSFYFDNNLVDLVSLLVQGNIFLSVLFIIFGFCSAFILAKNITSPIKKLAEGAGEFSNGNLKFKIDIKSDDEIGVLSNAFNSMAERLNTLYESLEQQVMERTHELSRKNQELKQAHKELKDSQSMMVHNEKMRSLGQLVAGVAHELNNPINFIYGNLVHLKNYSNDLAEVIKKYEEIQKQFDDESIFKDVDDFKQEIDCEFLIEDLSALIKSCTDGAERSKQIILDLKNFSRLDEALVKEVDIHEGIDSALNILQSKYKEKVTIHKEFGDIPQVMCYAGQVNQVFMNILDNAAQAFETQGDIFIRTKLANEEVVIEFEDNGSGIDKETLPKIFDPFFTTKPVGEGTGLGLSICYKIIKSHNGKMEVESEKGRGTKFIITLPINWSAPAENNDEQHSESEKLELDLDSDTNKVEA